MKKFIVSSMALLLVGFSAHAAEFASNCYPEAEAYAVRYIDARYHTEFARGGAAIDGEGDDIHVQVQLNGRTVCLDVGVLVATNGSCSLQNEMPQIIDCNE